MQLQGHIQSTFLVEICSLHRHAHKNTHAEKGLESSLYKRSYDVKPQHTNTSCEQPNYQLLLMIAPTQALCFTGVQTLPLNVSLRKNCGTTCPVFLSDLVFLLVVFLLIACFTILQLLLMNRNFHQLHH